MGGKPTDALDLDLAIINLPIDLDLFLFFDHPPAQSMGCHPGDDQQGAVGVLDVVTQVV